MDIRYCEHKDFEQNQLRELFLSVEWDSGNYPDKLLVAMKNSDKVYSAWDGDKLIGLMNCLSDGIMTAYFHYLLVRPEYQGKGVGKELVRLMLQEYKECARKVLIAYKSAIEFYRKCGFEESMVSVPMSVTYLKT